MNKTIYRKFILLLQILGFGTLSWSQTPGESPKLPDHLLSDAEAISRSTDIAVITLLQHGNVSDGPPGIEEYDDSLVRIEQVLKGSVQCSVRCSYDRFDWPSSKAESIPTEDTRYVVFMHYRGPFQGNQLYSISKFSAYSEDHLAEIKSMIASSQPAQHTTSGK